MCFDRNINGNKDVKFLIAIIGHCTDQRKLLYNRFYSVKNSLEIKFEKLDLKITKDL